MLTGSAQGRPARAARRRRPGRQDARRYHVGFMVAPRVNAAGRMSSPDIATRLLLARDEAMADGRKALADSSRPRTPGAGRRSRTSSPRRGRSSRPIRTSARSVLVVAGEGWHRGVIGIVASKLVDAYYSPAIVLSIEDGVAHGSGRSIPGFDLLARARVVRADASPLRRSQGGGRPAAASAASGRSGGR